MLREINLASYYNVFINTSVHTGVQVHSTPRHTQVPSVSTNSSHLSLPDLLAEVLLGLVLQLPDVVQGEPVPSIHPAEQLSVELGEDAALGLVDEGLGLALHAEPLELHRDQLVAGHDRLHLGHPHGVTEGAASGLLALEGLGVVLGVVV